MNGNPYETDSTILRVVINEGGASISKTDLSPQGTEWEFAIEVTPGSTGLKKNILADGNGAEIELGALGIPVIAQIDLSTTNGVQQALADIELLETVCLGH